MNRLQWRLTLNYALVTASAMLVAQVICIGLLATYLWSLVDTAIVPAVADAAAARAEPFIRMGDDPARVAEQLIGVIESSSGLLTPGDPLYRLAVYALDGELIAQVGALALPEAVRAELGEVLTGGQPTNGQTETGTYTSMTPFGGSPLVGVSVFVAEPGLFTNYLWNTVVTLLAAGLTAFSLFSLLVGTAFGYLTARRLTRRLAHIERVSAAWGDGQLRARIDDPSADEVGALVRHLNRIAAQLDDHLALEQQVAALNERNRIARDLHDSVKQQLFAAIMQAASADSLLDHDAGRARNHLRESLRLAQGAQAELTGLIHELRPLVADGKGGLSAALRDYAEAWARRTGIRLNDRLDGLPDLPEHAARQVYRIVQEALANIERHSGAASVTLTGEVSSNKLRLTLRDDGCGIDPQAARGVGTRSMRERAELLGGHLLIESQPGAGTTVRLEMEMNHGNH